MDFLRPSTINRLPTPIAKEIIFDRIIRIRRKISTSHAGIPLNDLGDKILQEPIENGIHTLIQVVGPFGNLPSNPQNFIPATGCQRVQEMQRRGRDGPSGFDADIPIGSNISIPDNGR